MVAFLVGNPAVSPTPAGIAQATAFGGAVAGTPGGVDGLIVAGALPVAIPGGAAQPVGFGTPSVSLSGAAPIDVFPSGLAQATGFGGLPVGTPNGLLAAGAFGGAVSGLPSGLGALAEIGALPVAVPGGIGQSAGFGAPSITFLVTADTDVTGGLAAARLHLEELLFRWEELHPRRPKVPTNVKRPKRRPQPLLPPLPKTDQLEYLLLSIELREAEIRLAAIDAESTVRRQLANAKNSEKKTANSKSETDLRRDDQEAMFALGL